MIKAHLGRTWAEVRLEGGATFGFFTTFPAGSMAIPINEGALAIAT